MAVSEQDKIDRQNRLDEIPFQHEPIKPLLAAAMEKYGERWRYPFVIARRVLTDMLRESSEINEQTFWLRFEHRLKNPPPVKMIHKD